MSKYTSGSFDLIVDKKKAQLLYNGEKFMEGCDNILQLLLNLGLGDTMDVDCLNLDEEEIEWLENMLIKKIYTDNICLFQK